MYPTTGRRVSIFDATLRDGEQAPDNTMGIEAKVRLALMAEDAGVDVIECGFPASSPLEAAAAGEVARAVRSATVATFNRACREDVDASLQAVGAGPGHQLQICGTGSDIHLEHKLGITRADAVRAAVATVAHAREQGVHDVSFGVEDASRGQWDHIATLVRAVVDAGAGTIVLADTTGYATPQEFGALCAAVRGVVGADVHLGTHCHDDLGLAVANSIAGVQAGADQVQATFAGIGERAGNASLEQVVAVLAMKAEAIGAWCGVRTERLDGVVRELEDVLGREVGREKAVVGRHAFSTEAGIHQAGILREPTTYEFLPPALFGRERTFVLGRHSGRAAVRHATGGAGGEHEVQRRYAALLEGEHGGTVTVPDATPATPATPAPGRRRGAAA